MTTPGEVIFTYFQALIYNDRIYVAGKGLGMIDWFEISSLAKSLPRTILGRSRAGTQFYLHFSD